MKLLRSLFFLILFIIKYYSYFFNEYLEEQTFFAVWLILKNIRWQSAHCSNITMKYEYCSNIPFIIFWMDIARFLQYFRNLSKSFINILAILQHFNGIFLKYFLNITVLCGYITVWSVCLIVNYFVEFSKYIWFFSEFSYHLQNTVFDWKFEAATVKLSVQISRK